MLEPEGTGNKEQRTMAHVLLLWQIRPFEVIIRQGHGRLHHQSSAILDLVGRIRLSLSLIGLSFGRLWVRVGLSRRRGGIGVIGVRRIWSWRGDGDGVGVGVGMEVGGRMCGSG